MHYQNSNIHIKTGEQMEKGYQSKKSDFTTWTTEITVTSITVTPHAMQQERSHTFFRSLKQHA
jgi:hypothetical protein